MARRWLVLAVLFAARASTGFQFQSVGSGASLLIRDLGIDYSRIGILLGAYLLPGVVVAFPAGLAGRRFREKMLGLAGLALMVVSGLGFSNSDNYVQAFVARTVGGVGATILILAATKLTSDWFEGREIVVAMSLLQMSWPFGAMLALPVQAYFAEIWGWRAIMVSGALCAAAVFCAFLFVSEPVESKPRRISSRTRFPVAALLPVTIAGTIWGAMNLACILFFSYAPLLLVAYGYSSTGAASLTSLAIWFTILAIPVGGYVVQCSGRPLSAIMLCSGVAATALLLFVAGFHPTLGCLIFGIAVGPMSGAILSLPSKVLEPSERAVGFGIFYTCFYVLMAVGPSVAGYLQDVWQSPAAAVVASAAALVVIMPLSIVFASSLKPVALAELDGPTRLRAPS